MKPSSEAAIYMPVWVGRETVRGMRSEAAVTEFTQVVGTRTSGQVASLSRACFVKESTSLFLSTYLGDGACPSCRLLELHLGLNHELDVVDVAAPVEWKCEIDVHDVAKRRPARTESQAKTYVLQ